MTPVRRRQAALGTVAALALVAGAIAGARDGGPGETPEPNVVVTPRAPGSSGDSRPPEPERAAVDRLPLPEQVGQLIVLRYMGTTPPAYVRRNLRANRVAGVILFRDNIASPDALRAATHALDRAARAAPPIVSTDQEGGVIRNVDWVGPVGSQSGQLAAGKVRSAARQAAQGLRASGINVTLAPVLDVPSVDGAAMSGREFARDAESVAAAAGEAVAGWRDGGVAATAKHFPGLGGATVNTDDGPATIERSRADLERDLAPFAAAVDAGVPLVMAGHARYPALDPDRIASQSPDVLRILREDLGFRGVIVTDSQEAAAVTRLSAVGVASERAIRAGADLILTTGQGSYLDVYRRLLAAARSSPELRARVRESAARVLALRRSLPRPG